MSEPGRQPRVVMARPRLVIATTNAGKLREFAALAGCGPLDGLVEVVGLDHPALAGRRPAAVPEESLDLAENAAAKARAAASATGLVAVADDTGLYVEALGGRPGPRAARYAGPQATDADRIGRLLRELQDVPHSARTAEFRCALAVAVPPGWPPGPGADPRVGPDVRVFEGVCRGLIAERPAGTGGFGYDPVFWLPELGRTLAELTLDEKNRLSHRARAWRKAEPYLVELLVGGGGVGAGLGRP